MLLGFGSVFTRRPRMFTATDPVFTGSIGVFTRRPRMFTATDPVFTGSIGVFTRRPFHCRTGVG
ncbi:hypothetical protein AMK22_13650 [Streptomyces sp. CB01580]|nr:hypothetical protein AMK22_13650 [Streptomyces sp. CB01580]